MAIGIERLMKTMPGMFPPTMQRGRAITSFKRRGNRVSSGSVRAYTRTAVGEDIMSEGRMKMQRVMSGREGQCIVY